MLSLRAALVSALFLGCSFTIGCSSPASSDAADDSDDTSTEDLSRCHPLIESNAATLMPPGSSEADGVGTFVVQTSTRGNNDVTGAGPWSAWDDEWSGEINLYALESPQYGPLVQMSLYNVDESSPTWDIDQDHGLVEDGSPNYRTTQVDMYLQHIGDYGTIATFQTKNIRSSTCSFTAMSDPVSVGYNTQMRVRVKGTFKKPK